MISSSWMERFNNRVGKNFKGKLVPNTVSANLEHAKHNILSVPNPHNVLGNLANFSDLL